MQLNIGLLAGLCIFATDKKDCIYKWMSSQIFLYRIFNRY